MRTILVALLLPVTAASAQTDTTQVPAELWKHSLVTGLNLTQVAFKDWAQGGENALSYTVSLEGKSTRNGDLFRLINTYKLAFGQTRLGIQGLRKTDDKIDLESVLTYKLGTQINPYAAATLKSQFATGFKFDAAGNKTPVSKFFDPAYLTQSVGFGYQPLPEVKTRFGGAVREIITSVYTSYSDDPATPGVERTKIDGGLESVTNIDWKIADNLLLTGKLEIFAAFSALDVLIIRSDNSLSAKVNQYISVILNVQLINDQRVTARTQVKETLGLGISYTFL